MAVPSPTPEELARMGIVPTDGEQGSLTPEEMEAAIRARHIQLQIENAHNGVHAAAREKAKELAKFRENPTKET